MSELLTAAQMSAVEKAAIEAGEVTGLELMERAGRGVVEAMMAWRPELARTPHRAVVLCGPGNNGGDGFVIARLLKQHGWEVEVCLYGDGGKLPPDAVENAQRWRKMGEISNTPYNLSGSESAWPDLRIDAVFGGGLSRPFRRGEVTTAPRDVLDDTYGFVRRPVTVAVDAPSGLCLDSGRIIGEAISADLTVSFHRPRLGHLLADGPVTCGALRIVDIGLEDAHRRFVPSLFARSGDGTGWNAFHPVDPAALVREARPGKLEKKQGHKYDHGHALICSGGVGTGGAARLAARAALRVGAGAVTVAAPPAALIENAAQLNAIMLRPMRDLATLLDQPDAAKMNAICLGPGLGRGEATRKAAAAACSSGRNVVLDADALTSFEEEPQALFEHLHERCVLTPHFGEFRRLCPDLAERLSDAAETGPAYSKIDATRDAAARAGCTVLLKGADTTIAAPDGHAAVNAAVYDRAAPWLATAGAGDVLAGFVTGLLARGISPMSAACAAAWLHVEAARTFGPGLIAEDLPEQLPAVFRELGI